MECWSIGVLECGGAGEWDGEFQDCSPAVPTLQYSITPLLQHSITPIPPPPNPMLDLIPFLPAVNATLNGVSTVLLIWGRVHIRRQRITAHRKCMLAAFVTSAVFLASYLTYHIGLAYYLHRGPTIFRDPAWFRPIYLGILLTHTVLAAAIVPLVIITLVRGLRGRFDRHKKIARWTWPLWVYVSVTGVLIYLLLYQVFPQRG
jgi:uncharacterized membrane protein YozB (DUF420 family)